MTNPSSPSFSAVSASFKSILNREYFLLLKPGGFLPGKMLFKEKAGLDPLHFPGEAYTFQTVSVASIWANGRRYAF